MQRKVKSENYLVCQDTTRGEGVKLDGSCRILSEKNVNAKQLGLGLGLGLGLAQWGRVSPDFALI